MRRLLLTSSLLVLLSAAPARAVMKMLSPSTGWVIEREDLYWTKDAGSHWEDITPVPPSIRGVSVHSVFFRDTSEGWVIVAYPEPVSAPATGALRDRKSVYSIAHTADGGDSWSFTPLSYSGLPQGQDAFPADMFFLDSRHGWLVIGLESMRRPGKLLVTEDGGKTWNWVNSPGFSGEIAFLSLQDGWLLSYEAGDELYVTHDGSRTWQLVSLSPPPQVGAATHPTYQATPVFQNKRKGYLAVHYSGGPEVASKLVVYSTIDGGRTWRPVKVLDVAEEAGGFPFPIVGSTMVVSTGLRSKGGSVVFVLLDGRPSEVRVSDRGVFAISFADRRNGWVSRAEEGWMATRDGGATWKKIELKIH